MSLRFSGRPKASSSRVDLNRLSQPDVLASYQNELASRLVTTPPNDVDEHWSHIHQTLETASFNSCGLSHRATNHWISGKSVQLLDARRMIPADNTHADRRTAIKRQLKESLQKDREIWWSERATEMEVAAASGNSRKLFHLIRTTGTKRIGVSETIREVDGSPIYNLERRLERWVEHFSQQFNWPIPSVELTIESPSPTWLAVTYPPTFEEVLEILTTIKRHKAPGPDALAPALFKDGGIEFVRKLVTFFSKVWNEECIPSAWNEAVIMPIFKKGARNECGNHRGISLIPVAPKLLTSVILRRLSSIREGHAREEQAGFRPGRGCIDQIFTLRQLLEHRHTYRRPTITVFLDIRAAFDSIDRSTLWNCLLKYGVPDKYIRILKALYKRTSGKVMA